MKKLSPLFILPLAFALTSVAQASETFDFYWSGNTTGEYLMTTCDVVSEQAKRVADLFELKIEDIQCSGGMQGYAGMWPISLRVKYLNPDFTGVQTVDSIRKLEADRSSPMCNLHTRMIRQWVKKLSFVKFKSKHDGCMNNQSLWDYEFIVQTVGQTSH